MVRTLIDYRDENPDKTWEEKINQAAEFCLEHLGYDQNDYEISISFVDDEEIAMLNREYRGHDSITDVLSFPMEMEAPFRPIPLGDVVINLEQAKRQAMDFGHGLDRELIYLFVHSVLHLLGFDHETEHEKEEMRHHEEAIMNGLQLQRR